MSDGLLMFEILILLPIRIESLLQFKMPSRSKKKKLLLNLLYAKYILLTLSQKTTMGLRLMTAV